MEEEFHERRFLNRELARALASRSFDVHYQPIVRPEGAAIIGVEALLRWDHPRRGPIPPGTFVPVAEEAGLMPQLGEFVLRRAISDAESLRLGQRLAGAAARPCVRRARIRGVAGIRI
jgi:EAL domain-containing protein (putative c-di-GMP-specific phosphodiesterase class I)